MKGLGRNVLCSMLIIYIGFSLYYPIWLIFQSDENTKESLKEVAICPCRMKRNWKRTVNGFEMDPGCDAQKWNYWNCLFHRGAKGCYRKKSLKNIHGAQCCYDLNGYWIEHWKQGGGTLDYYYSQTLNNLSIFQHFFSDVLSYLSSSIAFCSFFNFSQEYFRYRPTGICQIYSTNDRFYSSQFEQSNICQEI